MDCVIYPRVEYILGPVMEGLDRAKAAREYGLERTICDKFGSGFSPMRKAIITILIVAGLFGGWVLWLRAWCESVRPAGPTLAEHLAHRRAPYRRQVMADFQGIYKSENPEDFVRRVLFQRFLVPDPSVSRAEMAEIVLRVKTCGQDADFYLELFLVNCKHPSGTDLIYWPNLVSELPQHRKPTAEEIADLALRGGS